MAKLRQMVAAMTESRIFSYLCINKNSTIMELIEAIRLRHSVRKYAPQAVSPEAAERLQALIGECNAESGLHLQLVLEEPKAFAGGWMHYGKIQGARNYLALIGKKSEELDEQCGYYGERIVLEAQCLGLNSCWVGLTYRKVPQAFSLGQGEKLVAVAALGYGETQGMQRKSKTPEQVATLRGDEPQWFLDGVSAALLAPTAMNQQKFRFEYLSGKVAATTKRGPFCKVDLGIAKLHFEIGAAGNCIWA